MSAIYDRLSRMVAMLPATAAEIAADIDVAQRTVLVWARYLRSRGIVAYGPIRGRTGRVLVKGDGSEFDMIPERGLGRGVILFAEAWHRLSRRCTTDDLAEVLGTRRRTASEIVRSMRDHRVARVAGWEFRGKTTLAPIYDRLPCPSVPRPPRTPRTYVNAKHWARRSSNLQQGAQA